jgi:hypothetical protein
MVFGASGFASGAAGSGAAASGTAGSAGSGAAGSGAAGSGAAGSGAGARFHEIASGGDGPYCTGAPVPTTGERGSDEGRA